ncbi:hypothetical protein ACR34G_02845 [Mycoplasma sp. 480]|uniref:hypothetical protein n=1 Tax=Mycoplasma sp. 480 TaxID=3440155 RepID=UPI003F50D49F
MNKIYSNKRKLTLCGWLKENDINSYNNPLKLQKFLLFYELFSKIANEEFDFSYLKGYEKGPVFSNVYGDYKNQRSTFNKIVEEIYKNNQDKINSDRALKCSFIVKTATESTLSNVTHKLNLWKSKEELINKKDKNVPLDEKDFNNDDQELIKTIDSMYLIEQIKNSEVIHIKEKFFVFSKQDFNNLTNKQKEILEEVADSDELYNPIYVEIDEEDGGLIFD